MIARFLVLEDCVSSPADKLYVAGSLHKFGGQTLILVFLARVGMFHVCFDLV